MNPTCRSSVFENRDKLLTKYDMLVEIAELRAAELPRSGASVSLMAAGSELLLMKSERIRIQILHDELPTSGK